MGVVMQDCRLENDQVCSNKVVLPFVVPARNELSIAHIMDNEKTTANQSVISGLSPKIIVHDVGAISDSSGQASQLKKGLLFVSTPFDFASAIDKRYLRVDLGMKTIVNTLPRPDGRRYVFDGPALDKKGENFCIEDVLGLKSCLVVLRSDAFIKNALNEMPSRSRR